MDGKITSVLLTETQIQERVEALGTRISEDYAGGEIVGICLLKGSIVFTADLMRHIRPIFTLEVMRASSYDGAASSGSVKILYDLDRDIGGRDVLIIEDIVDTGRTLHKTVDLLQSRRPNSLRICSLLDKPSRRVEPLDIDMVGFTIEDHFVVGYGLDYNEHYRNLPYIGILDPGA